MRLTAEDVITIGQALIRQKAALPHGSFLPWIEAEFDMAVRTAQRKSRPEAAQCDNSEGAGCGDYSLCASS